MTTASAFPRSSHSSDTTTPISAGIRHLSLTSVDPVSRDVGIRAAQLLLERMADPSLPQRTEVLHPAPGRAQQHGTSAGALSPAPVSPLTTEV